MPTAIQTELNGILYPLATTEYLVKQRAGLVDREFLEWLLPICKNYQGMYADERVPKSIESQLKINSNQLKELNEKTKSDGTKALTLRKIKTPFIDLNIHNLVIFPGNFQLKILDIKDQLDLFNSIVEDSSYYLKMTYAPGVTDENYKIAVRELELNYKYASDKATTIAKAINNFINNYNNKVCI